MSDMREALNACWVSWHACYTKRTVAELLTIVVGGSSLVAAVTVFKGREVGVLASMAAGLIMAGFIVMEAVWSVGPRTWLGIEGVYLGLGLAVFGLLCKIKS